MSLIFFLKNEYFLGTYNMLNIVLGIKQRLKKKSTLSLLLEFKVRIKYFKTPLRFLKDHAKEQKKNQ